MMHEHLWGAAIPDAGLAVQRMRPQAMVAAKCTLLRLRCRAASGSTKVEDICHACRVALSLTGMHVLTCLKKATDQGDHRGAKPLATLRLSLSDSYAFYRCADLAVTSMDYNSQPDMQCSQPLASLQSLKAFVSVVPCSLWFKKMSKQVSCDRCRMNPLHCVAYEALTRWSLFCKRFGSQSTSPVALILFGTGM